MSILCPPKILKLIFSNHSWRRTRRAAHESLTKVAVRDYHPILRKEAIILATAILETPDPAEKHFQRFAASAIMSILYDYPTLENEHDKTLGEIHAFIDRMSVAAAPGAHLVELFPWMMLIPERYVSISCPVTDTMIYRQVCEVEARRKAVFHARHEHVQRTFEYRSQ